MGEEARELAKEGLGEMGLAGESNVFDVEGAVVEVCRLAGVPWMA